MEDIGKVSGKRNTDQMIDILKREGLIAPRIRQRKNI